MLRITDDSADKESACTGDTGDEGLIPGSGKRSDGQVLDAWRRRNHDRCSLLGAPAGEEDVGRNLEQIRAE